MTADQEKVLQQALDTYGIQGQTLMLAEECSEVVQAASKLVRMQNIKSQQSLDNLIEEIADVRIMLKQMRMYYGIKDEQIEQVMCMKINRLERNLNS